MSNDKIETGKRVTELRKNLGYSREHLAELSELSISFLADIENGKKDMTVHTLRKIASALMTSPDYLVNGAAYGENTNIINMLNTLSSENKKQAEKLLAVFIETLNS